MRAVARGAEKGARPCPRQKSARDSRDPASPATPVTRTIPVATPASTLTLGFPRTRHRAIRRRCWCRAFGGRASILERPDRGDRAITPRRDAPGANAVAHWIWSARRRPCPRTAAGYRRVRPAHRGERSGSPTYAVSRTEVPRRVIKETLDTTQAARALPPTFNAGAAGGGIKSTACSRRPRDRSIGYHHYAEGEHRFGFRPWARPASGPRPAVCPQGTLGKKRTGLKQKGAEYVYAHPNGFQLGRGHGATGGSTTGSGRGVIR